MNSVVRDTFGTEKRVEFKVTLVGYGHSVQEAWEDAIESFQKAASHKWWKFDLTISYTLLSSESIRF